MFSLIIYLLITAIGFMMAFLYKQAYTTSRLFNPEPRKLCKIFLSAFAGAVVVTIGLSGWTLHVLNSSPVLEMGKVEFHNARQVLFFSLNFFFLVLMVLSNLYSQAQKKISLITYLLTFIFYTLTVVLDSFWISEKYIVWQGMVMKAAVSEIDIPDFHSTGLMKCGLAFLVTVFNAIIIWWGLRK